MYICNKWHVLYILVDCPISTRPDDSQLKCTARTNCRIYTLLPPEDGHLANPKRIEV
jgi:hypothetical protein